MTSPLERAAQAVLADLRDRRTLGYLFVEGPEDAGAFGYINQPIDAETQAEIAASLARAVILAIREPSEGMIDAAVSVEMISCCKGDPTADNPDDLGIWQAMIDAALSD